MSDRRFLTERPRRLRRTPALRRLVQETTINAAGLILPMFVKEGLAAPAPIASMPGVVQHDEASFRTAVNEAAEAGVGGVMVFGIPDHRDANEASPSL